jgi:hypothetical protein
VWARVVSLKACNVDKSDCQSHDPSPQSKDVPWKQPGLQTGTSTINSALSFSQLPDKLPSAPVFTPSSIPSICKSSPFLCLLLLSSTNCATSSPNFLVSPSASLAFVLLNDGEAYGLIGGALAYDLGAEFGCWY